MGIRNDGEWFCAPLLFGDLFLGFAGLFVLRCHFGVEIKQLLQPLGIIFKAAADVDALQHFVVALMGTAQIVGHLVGGVEIGNGSGEMGFPCQQDIFGAAG